MDIMEFHEIERAGLRKGKWEFWCEAVEKIVGHDLDGDQESDGYSLDFAGDAFDAGMTPAQYAATIKRQ